MSGRLVFIILMCCGLLFAGDMFRVVKIDAFPRDGKNLKLYLAAGKCLDYECSNVDESKVIFYKIDALKCFRSSKTVVDFEICAKLYELDTENPLSIPRLPFHLLVRSKEAEKGSRFVEFYWIPGYLGKQNLRTVKQCRFNYCYDSRQTDIRMNKITPNKLSISVKNPYLHYDGDAYIDMLVCLALKGKVPPKYKAIRTMAERFGYYGSLKYKLQVNVYMKDGNDTYSYRYRAFIILPLKINICYPIKILLNGYVSAGESPEAYMVFHIEDEKFLGFEAFKVFVNHE